MLEIQLNKKYYVFDIYELYQVRRLYENNTFSIDHEIIDIYDIAPLEDCVEVTFVNKCPVLVDAEEYNSKINQSRFSMDCSLLDVVPFNIVNYKTLEELLKHQNKNSEESSERKLINNERNKACESLKILKHEP